jgi:serine/threonine-protein kinase
VSAVTSTATPTPPPPASADLLPPDLVADLPASASAMGSGSSPAPSAAIMPANPGASAPPSAAAGPAEVPTDVSGGMGIIRTTGAPASHRVFIDERVVGQTPDPISIRCGPHTIRIGSSGQRRTIEVPCGGEVAVDH